MAAFAGAAELAEFAAGPGEIAAGNDLLEHGCLQHEGILHRMASIVSRLVPASVLPTLIKNA